MFPGHKTCQMVISHCTMTVLQYTRENPALYRRRSWVVVCPACDMPSFAPCLHEEADTIMFAQSTETARRANKKIRSHTVGTDVVVLVIHVLQQL